MTFKRIVQIEVPITSLLCGDILSSGRNGIAYWARGLAGSDTPDGEYSIYELDDIGNAVGVPRRVSRNTVCQGIIQILQQKPDASLVNDTIRGYVYQILIDPNSTLMDASLADVIIQVGLFGEVVYG